MNIAKWVVTFTHVNYSHLASNMPIGHFVTRRQARNFVRGLKNESLFDFNLMDSNLVKYNIAKIEKPSVTNKERPGIVVHNNNIKDQIEKEKDRVQYGLKTSSKGLLTVQTVLPLNDDKTLKVGDTVRLIPRFKDSRPAKILTIHYLCNKPFSVCLNELRGGGYRLWTIGSVERLVNKTH